MLTAICCNLIVGSMVWETGAGTGRALLEVDMGAAYYEAFGGPENVKIGERPDTVPDADHMLVRTHAAGVGIWDVFMMRRAVGQASLPRIPGSAPAGAV